MGVEGQIFLTRNSKIGVGRVLVQKPATPPSGLLAHPLPAPHDTYHTTCHFSCRLKIYQPKLKNISTKHLTNKLGYDNRERLRNCY